jgi:hypothetical protein
MSEEQMYRHPEEPRTANTWLLAGVAYTGTLAW